jgi:hypothetical protein
LFVPSDNISKSIELPRLSAISIVISYSQDSFERSKGERTDCHSLWDIDGTGWSEIITGHPGKIYRMLLWAIFVAMTCDFEHFCLTWSNRVYPVNICISWRLECLNRVVPYQVHKMSICAPPAEFMLKHWLRTNCVERAQELRDRSDDPSIWKSEKGESMSSKMIGCNQFLSENVSCDRRAVERNLSRFPRRRTRLETALQLFIIRKSHQWEPKRSRLICSSVRDIASLQSHKSSWPINDFF